MGAWAYTQQMEHLVDATGERILFVRGKGAHLYDTSGKRYVDFCNGYGAVTLGYDDPDLIEASRRVLASGAAWLQVPTPHLEELGRLLLADFPRQDRVALFPGGTVALRAAALMARRATGRRLIVSAGYHGWDPMWSQAAEPFAANADGVIDFFFVLEKLADLLDRHRGEIAALIVSPDRSYFSEVYYRELSRLCASYQILTVADDVKCGYRYRLGSSLPDEVFAADVYAVSKGVANGARVSALVGPRALMETLADCRFTSFHDVPSAAAAVATLAKVKACETPVAIRRVGDRFVTGARERLAAARLPAEITGNGNLFQLVFGTQALNDAFYRLATTAGLSFYRNDNQCPSFAFDVGVCEEALEMFERVLTALRRELPAAQASGEVSRERLFAAAFDQCDGCMELAPLDAKLTHVRRLFEEA